jgi:co-chaperonin GroES (HSP10)
MIDDRQGRSIARMLLSRCSSHKPALDVKAADRVPFGKWAGTEVLIDGETRLILKKSDIWA